MSTYMRLYKQHRIKSRCQNKEKRLDSLLHEAEGRGNLSGLRKRLPGRILELLIGKEA